MTRFGEHAVDSAPHKAKWDVVEVPQVYGATKALLLQVQTPEMQEAAGKGSSSLQPDLRVAPARARRARTVNAFSARSSAPTERGLVMRANNGDPMLQLHHLSFHRHAAAAHDDRNVADIHVSCRSPLQSHSRLLTGCVLLLGQHDRAHLSRNE